MDVNITVQSTEKKSWILHWSCIHRSIHYLFTGVVVQRQIDLHRVQYVRLSHVQILGLQGKALHDMSPSDVIGIRI